jgi:AraC-like DNA-binding protein
MLSPNWEHVDSIVEPRIDALKNHVWPFASSFAVDVRFLILDRRQEIPLHRPDHLEVVLCEAGEVGYEVENCTSKLARNDVIIVGNHIRHRCLPTPPSRQRPRTIVLSFLPETVHSGTPLNDDFDYLLPFGLQVTSTSNVIRANPGLSRDIRELIERIRQQLPGATEFSRLAIRTYLKMILLSLVNHCAESKDGLRAFNRQREAAARLAPAFRHIQEHHDEPIRVSDVARMCATSSCCFTVLFKQVTGRSFLEYLNRFRVAKAKDLLANTNKTIAEISQETGFCNQSHFGVIFRRITESTPLSYRLQSHAVTSTSSLRAQ